MKTGDWLKTHKQEALLGGAGVVVAIALYMKSRSSSSGASSSTGQATTQGYLSPGVANTTGTDLYGLGGLEDQILSLQNAISTLPASTAPGTSGTSSGPTSPPSFASQAVPYSDLSLHGLGYSIGDYQSGIEADTSGNYFSTLGTAPATEALLESGGTAYYQPAPGVFSPITSVNQFNQLESQGGAPTTTYTKIGAPA